MKPFYAAKNKKNKKQNKTKKDKIAPLFVTTA